MQRGSLWVIVAVVGTLAFGCGKKEGDSGGSGPTLAGFQASADYVQLMATAADGTKLVADGKCDEALAKAKEALALVLKLVPDYGAIGEAAKSDKALSGRMSELNAARAVLEMGIEGYEEDPTSDLARIHCQGFTDTFAKISGAP